MKYADQQKIAALYGAADGKTFAQWLRSLNFIRNVSAHHSRLWNINVVERSRVPQGWPNNNRPFLYFCLMQQFLSVICLNSSWGQRLIKLLEEDFPDMPHQQITRDDFGTFQDWAEWTLWQTARPSNQRWHLTNRRDRKSRGRNENRRVHRVQGRRSYCSRK